MDRISIKNLPLSERPYERCEAYGPSVLTDAELIAVIIRNGTKDMTGVDLARKLLTVNPMKPGLSGLGEMDAGELKRIDGIGRVKALQIECIFELSRRIAKEKLTYGLEFDNPSAIAEAYMESMRFLKQEHMMLLMLDAKLRLIKEVLLSKGTVISTPVEPRDVFISVLKNEAVFFILIHNHPSGDPNPSEADIEITQRIKQCADLIGIPLIDHLIIGNSSFVSFKKMGML
ncbi:MAG: DNA repair protein RadC [Lachnospiraceae bacterium]|nr:DNA repair protein RadC [Lachnospiraceae bacterium]